jgi:hypothetical protein
MPSRLFNGSDETVVGAIPRGSLNVMEVLDGKKMISVAIWP